MSRIEEIEGFRWVQQTVAEIGLLMVKGKKQGIDEIIAVLERGTHQKPPGYVKQVRLAIQTLQEAKK